MNREKTIILGITSVFLIIIATLGFAYGYYSSFVRKIDKSKKITVTSGNSEITYIASLIEDENMETIKPGFTSVDYFAVQNTGKSNAMYFIYLENVINNFVNTEDITYSIYRTSGDKNMNFDYIEVDSLDYTSWEILIDEEVYPTKDGLLKETKEIITENSAYYIYAMVIKYKYRLDRDQSIDSDHIFGGHLKLIPTDTIDTENAYEKGTLAYEIINNSILNLNQTRYSTINLENLINDNSNNKLLSLTEDNYGISYYYRGNVIDNFVNFNNKCWKIIRIQGDGSIKLSLYNDTKCEDSKDQNFLIKKENEIVKAEYFEDITKELSDWYTTNNFSNVESYIKLDNWCMGNINNKYSTNDNTLIENIDNYIKENDSYSYIVKKRVMENNPTLKCDENSENYESLIGILSAEEIVYNGVIYNNEHDIATLNKSSYDIKTNANYIYTYDLKEKLENNSFAINPAITLKSGIKYVKGNGTIKNPYEIN